MKVCGQRTYSKVVYWSEAAQGGHFAALGAPHG
jgi:hypothetical protein